MRYVLVTPARNEESYLEKTIASVVCQTKRPERWVIVSDGSTDRTDEIIQHRSALHGWIRYLRMPEHQDRQFAAKVHAFEAGRSLLKDVPYEVIGNLDADLSFAPDTMAFLMECFATDPELGVAGVPFIEDGSLIYDYRFTNIQHVSGACQLFRKECFEDIGGYLPIKGGGIDWLAVTSARMMGWKTRTFTEKSVVHHRKIGTGNHKGLTPLFRQGRKDYCLGNHPLWEVFRAVYQMRFRPVGLGGLTILMGYIIAFIGGAQKEVPLDVRAFSRKEQLQRLRQAFRLQRRTSLK